ncbi:hypothetical protein DFH27DRAFT_329881 [Peziza echinospora]|nr:hypothetical protein DFH27DRAFT_329881 [Peziza echinospora]
MSFCLQGPDGTLSISLHYIILALLSGCMCMHPQELLPVQILKQIRQSLSVLFDNYRQLAQIFINSRLVSHISGMASTYLEVDILPPPQSTRGACSGGGPKDWVESNSLGPSTWWAQTLQIQACVVRY